MSDIVSQGYIRPSALHNIGLRAACNTTGEELYPFKRPLCRSLHPQSFPAPLPKMWNKWFAPLQGECSDSVPSEEKVN